MALSAMDALRMQADIRDVMGQRDSYLRTFVGAFAKDHPAISAEEDDELGPRVQAHLDNAACYHVEPKMLELARRRSVADDHFRGIEQINQFPPPDPIGWCVFGSPLVTSDVRMKKQHVLAISWGPAQARYVAAADRDKTVRLSGGQLLCLWGNMRISPDEIHRENLADPVYRYGVERNRGWFPTIIDFMPYDRRIGPKTAPVPLEKRQLMALDGEEWNREGTINYIRLACALWELMGEVLTVNREPAHLDRATRRWAARQRLTTGVTTMTLRRQQGPSVNPGSGTPLRWRIPVKAHPRTYHRGTPDEFTIDIGASWRGPKDAPRRVTEKIHTLKR